MRGIVADYALVRPNLQLHATGWPDPKRLAAGISSGQPAYGMAAVGPGRSSAGARAIISAADANNARPLWISVWGGANTLAQALSDVRATRSLEALAAFVAKLRVYSISDQDDAGPWIRREFPNLFYIVSPSSQDAGDYAHATWTEISGDDLYRNGQGADASTITNAWLERNIRNKGPLSRHYLRYEYIMEGDTPPFLGLIPNGLNDQSRPDWGGWGGRYVLRTPASEVRPIWTQGDLGPRVSSRDAVTGMDGRTYLSDQATIWRWRRAFQNDFRDQSGMWISNVVVHMPTLRRQEPRDGQAKRLRLRNAKRPELGLASSFKLDAQQMTRRAQDYEHLPLLDLCATAIGAPADNSRQEASQRHAGLDFPIPRHQPVGAERNTLLSD